jgi:ribosomal protein S6--L-glutamate ligase
MARKRICFLLERGNPPRRNRVLEATIALLAERGVMVWAEYPEETLIRLDRLAVEADLYLLKSNTDLALSLATALERLGAHVLNSCAATRQAKNKVQAASVLLRNRLPTPRSLAASRPVGFAAEVEAGGPLILKPHRGHYGLGLVVAERAGSLPASEDFLDRDVVFAQRFLANARTDLKIFGIGDTAFGVRKTFEAGTSFAREGKPELLSPELEDLARTTGHAFGLGLYGLDVAEDADGAPYMVDINAFPGYRGVPDAPRRLADYIMHQAA